MDDEDLDEEAEDAAQIEEIEIEAMEAEVLLILWNFCLSEFRKKNSNSYESGVIYWRVVFVKTVEGRLVKTGVFTFVVFWVRIPALYLNFDL